MRSDRFFFIVLSSFFAVMFLVGLDALWLSFPFACLFMFGVFHHWQRRKEPFSKEELDSLRNAPSGGG